MGKPLGLPARHYEAVGIVIGLVEEGLRIDGVHDLLVIGEDGGSVRTHLCKIRASPVEDRHEVVAHEIDAFLSQVLEGVDVVADVSVPVRSADLDGVMDVDALDSLDLKTCFLDDPLELVDPLPWPFLAGGDVV